MEIGKKIKALREARGWTQDELAKRMGYFNRSTICYIESGRNSVTMSKLAEFAEVFGVSTAELLGMNKPLADDDLYLFETVCKDAEMKKRLIAYAQKLKEVMDAENA